MGDGGEQDKEALADLLSLITSIGFRPEDGNGVTVDIVTAFDLSIFDVDMDQESSSSSSSSTSDASTSSSASIDLLVPLAPDAAVCDFGGCAENWVVN